MKPLLSASLGFRWLLFASLGLTGCATGGPGSVSAPSAPSSAPSAIKLTYWATFYNRKDEKWQGVYNVFLSKSWQKAKGTTVDEPMFELTNPQTRGVDDEMMQFVYSNILGKNGFFEFPARGRIDMSSLQRQDVKKWIVILETDQEKRIVDRDDLVLPPTPDEAGGAVVRRRLDGFMKIQENLIHLANLYPVFEMRTDREDPRTILPFRKLQIEQGDPTKPR